MRPQALLTISVITFALAPAVAGAQSPTSIEHRAVLFVDGGYARTIAPESLMGDGGSVSGGVGFELTPGKTIQGIINYVKYDHTGTSSTFDGRVVFIGAEFVFQSQRPRVQPFVSVGGGIFDIEDTRVNQRLVSPGRTIVDPPIPREFSFKGATSSGGVEFRLTEHASIRAGARIHLVLDVVRPDDSIPFMIFRPSIGAAFRW
jgi:hypothetical protein